MLFAAADVAVASKKKSPGSREAAGTCGET
jgi:hypothetical protein